MERLTQKSDKMIWLKDQGLKIEPCEMNSHHCRMILEKLAEYEDLEERLHKIFGEKSENVYKLPLFKETTGYGERDKQRHTKEYKKWRKEVLKRDNYICQMCGKPNSNIAHHKVRFRDCYDDKNIVYDIGNGVCLCKRCHKIAHGGGNYING